MAEATVSSPRGALLRGGLRLKHHAVKRTVRADLPDLAAIVSGGQVGADQAGLQAARALGLATGGFAPEGYRTLDGDDPRLGTEFGLVERGDSYAHRTASNVFCADATVRIASDFNSPGEVCTLQAIRKYGRPYIDYSATTPSQRPASWNPVHSDAITRLVAFLQEHRVHVLNVAGNARPDVGRFAEALLLRALLESSS